MNTAMCLTTPPSLWLPLGAMSTSISKLLLKDGADINSRCVFYACCMMYGYISSWENLSPVFSGEVVSR